MIELPHYIYNNHLRVLDGVQFTAREIDIIALFIGGRRSSQKIASLLSLSAKTVESHIKSIMQKLGSNSREEVIDFIEKHSNTLLLRRYYVALLNQALFEHLLKSIPALLAHSPPRCLIIYEDATATIFLQQLKKHLSLVGIQTVIEIHSQYSQLGQFLENVPPTSHQHVLVFLAKPFLENPENKRILNNLDQVLGSLETVVYIFSIDLEGEGVIHPKIENLKQDHYYFSVFSVLKKLLPLIDIKKIMAEFTQRSTEYLKDIEDSKATDPSFFKEKVNTTEATSLPHTNSSFIKKYLTMLRRPTLGLYVCCLVVLSLFCSLFIPRLWKEQLTARSDHLAPLDYYYLDRPALLEEIEKTLQNQSKQGEVSIVALVGIGGAGKTTLARRYVKQQKAKFIWEVNAETHFSLINSFEKMAQALCETENDRELLKESLNTSEPAEKSDKILFLVQEKLKSCSNWLLMYDNVEKLSDIRKHVPFDAKKWGAGKVIITTRDSNIQHNSHIKHTIVLGELNHQEKLNLFQKIIGPKNSRFNASKLQETVKFLEKIPSFPLDVSVAAYYIKETNVGYEKYLENLQTYSEEFEELQRNLLEGSFHYNKTRYSIISLSTSILLKAHQDFEVLLLFLSLLDSQDIPRELLNFCKESAVVDNFIFNLKRYSLINFDTLAKVNDLTTLSLHRSTQAILLEYIRKKINTEQEKKYIQEISNTIEKYIDYLLRKEDLSTMQLMDRHCTMFLSHHNLLTPEVKNIISAQLGYIRIFTNPESLVSSKEILEKSLINLNNSPEQNHLRIANILKYLGIIYRRLGEFDMAKSAATKSFLIFQKRPDNYAGLSRSLVLLGMIYRDLGEYEKSKSVLEQSLVVYQQYPDEFQIEFFELLYQLGYTHVKLGDYQKAKEHFEKSLKYYRDNFHNHWRVPLNLGSLSLIYNEWGHYEKALEILKESLEIYKRSFSSNDTYVMWALTQLGAIYRNLGDYKNAQDSLEQSLQLCERFSPNNKQRLSQSLAYLGIVHGKLGDYKKGINLIEKALQIYEQHYGIDHIETARILEMLGQVYLLKGDPETAEPLFVKALGIFQQKKHPDIYVIFESLADLYLKKAAQKNKNTPQSQEFKKKAFELLKQAQDILESHFPTDSPHLNRIQLKLAQQHSPP